MKDIKITIKQIEGREGEYLAFFKSEFKNSTFSVYFNDNIYGWTSLLDFSEMLKSVYENKKIRFEMSGEKLTFKNPNLLEVMIQPPN